jgi:cytochrome c
MWRAIRAAAGAGVLGALLAPTHPAAGSDDAVAGERLFRSQCMGCHSVEAGEFRAGPTLHGLFGRTSGTVEGFDFSPAMNEANIEWTSEALDAFLADPAGTVPGTTMVFWGLQGDQRRQIIAYLKEATE